MEMLALMWHLREGQRVTKILMINTLHTINIFSKIHGNSVIRFCSILPSAPYMYIHVHSALSL